jgi:hypothetical protein
MGEIQNLVKLHQLNRPSLRNMKTESWKYLLGNFCRIRVSIEIPDIMKCRGQYSTKML